MNNTPQVKAPWLKSKDPEVPAALTYSELSMCSRVEEMVRRYPDYIAYEFMGKCTTYAEMWKKINACAKSLKAIGIREGDKVTICMPNAPQTLCMFYAVNMVGAIANMVHPLSAESEIAFYLRDSGSVAAITLDQFYNKFESVRKAVDLPCLIITSVADELKPLIKVGYKLTEGRKNPKVPSGRAGVLSWKEFLRRGEYVEIYQVRRKAEDPAAILYSGGTTGVTKGILLSNRNFNALAAQIIATNPFFRPGHKMLAIMPMFHGFGLGVSIHSMVANGGHCILIPRFTPQSYAELIKKHQPNLIAGVPSLFEALLRVKEIEGADLSCLLGVFSGGDSLSAELKKRFDAFLKEHGATITVREGYGTTECVTASCLTPIHKQKEGSIGIPFPDTYYKIVKPGTQEEVPYGEEGEICLSGPTVMLEYVNHPGGDGPDQADPCRWPDLDPHRRPGHDGRGRLHLFPPAHQAHDRYQRLQRLSLPAGEYSGGSRVRPPELRHRRQGPHQDAAGQGVCGAQARLCAHGGLQAGADGILPQAHRQVRHALGHRVPG